ncbi:MAG: T9SS type A sorting domain-containing protein, partial [Calditrichaeota bacterium]|nr:T9SS type A sorting domain-containing protein [Calditrichota bacterium]
YIGQSGLFRIIDVHNPEEPEQVAEVQTRGFVCDIVASGDNLYVADTPDPRNRDYFPSVWWFNIEIPTSPQYMGCYLSEASYSIRSIKIQDGFLYMLGQNLSSRQPRIEVVHITNPRQMSLLGWQNIPQGGLNFDVSGEYIYVANNWNFDIYDCSQSLNVEMHQERVVDDFTVLEIYPNPFNSTVKIEFSLAYDQFVGGVVLDINGRQVADLSSSSQMQQGKNTLRWDAEGYPSGIYLIKVNLNGITKVNQIILQK